MVSISLTCRMILSKKSATFWDHAQADERGLFRRGGTGGRFDAAGQKPGDPHQGQILAMTPLTLGVLPPPLLEGNSLRPARLFDNLARDAGAFDKRGSQSRFAVLRQHEHIERHAVAGFAGKRHDGDRIPSGDAILFAAGFDDCEQRNFPRVPSGPLWRSTFAAAFAIGVPLSRGTTRQGPRFGG